MKKATLTISFMAAMAVPASAATVIPLTNPGFDANTLADGVALTTGITGWVKGGTSGIYNPLSTQATPVSGDNIAYSANGTSQFYQDTGHDLLANTTYTFTIYVGMQTQTAGVENWRTQLVTSNTTGTIGTVTNYAQLVDGGSTATLDLTTTAVGIDPGPLAKGTLHPVSLSWTTTASSPGLGNRLFVRFFSDSPQAIFDNAALSYVPEPSGMFMAGGGLLLGLLRRRVAR